MVLAGSLRTASVSNSGTFTVNGSLRAATVTNRGTLGGGGEIRGQVTNYGVISPGNSIGTLSVVGSVSFEPGSTYAAEIASDGTCDLLAVSGAVELNGGTLSTSLPRALYTDGYSWGLITTSEGVTGDFDGLDGQPASAVLSLRTVNSGDALSLDVVRQSYGSFATGGAADTGRGLDELVTVAKGDLADLLLSMDWDMDAAGIAEVAEALNPEMYTAFSAAALNAGSLFDQALARRLEELRQRRLRQRPAGRRPGPGL